MLRYTAPLILLSLLLPLRSTHAAKDELDAYAGTPALEQIESVTLVYPADGAEGAELNLLSAERRADYVRAQFGTDVKVVADADLTDEQRSGHLLILGWDNRLATSGPLGDLLETDDEGGRVFAGEIRVRREEDLMLSVASPVAPGKRWIFWSRIDPELDRFSVLPLIGSDWAVYRGYEVASQGMMKDRTVWPPEPNEWAKNEFPDFRERYPAQGRSEHYTIRYPKGAITSEERDAILGAREEALAVALERLGKPSPPMRIDLFVFPDPSIKVKATSVPDEVHSLARPQELLMVSAYARTPNPHEEVHLVAQRLMGPTFHTALYEGLALAISGMDPEQRKLTAAALLEHGEAPSIDALLDEGRLLELIEQGLGYPASDLLLVWLMERGGLELVTEIYSTFPLDAEILARHMGTSADKLQADFTAWLQQMAEGGETQFRFEQARAAAAMHSRAKNYTGAIVELKRALEIRPGDPDTLYRLVVAEMKSEQWPAAEEHLDQLLAHEEELPPEASRYVVFGHYLRGKIFDATGRPDAARGEYEHVLSLPEQHDSHGMARKALEESSSRAGTGASSDDGK